MKNRLIRSRGCAFALPVISMVFATSVQAIEVNPVVVSASRIEQPLSDVLPAVSVITRDEIEKSQSMTLADLLQGEAGFEFARNGGPGTLTSFFLRGQNSANLVLMIDGVRVQTDSLGSLTQTNMPLTQIDRIEILRGNAGALYGDAAIGGVINIFTRKGKGTMAPYGSVSYGAYNTRDLSVGYGGEVDGTGLDLSAGSSKSDGFSSMNKLQNTSTDPSSNGYSKSNVALRFERKVSESLRLGFRVASATSDTSYDKNDTNAYNFKSTNDTVNAFVRQQVNESWSSTLDLTHAVLKYQDMKNGNPYPLTGYTSSFLNGKQDGLRWGNVYEITKGHKASFGVDVLKDEYDKSGVYGNKTNRGTKGYYGGLTSHLELWTLQANVRRDSLDLDNTANSTNAFSRSKIEATSTLLGAGYQLNSLWKLTGTTSTGFRAPTAYDISTNSPVKQEEFKSQEAGVVYANASTYGRLVYYKTTTTNAIDYVYGPAPNYATSAVNIGETRNSGFESTFRANWNGYSIKATVVSQDPWNVTKNTALSRRARQYGSLDVSRSVGALEVGTRIYTSGTRNDVNYAPYPSQAVILDGYTLWSLYASRKIDDNWTARVRLENVFDKQYQLAYGYNTPGRGVFATLQYSPK
jgi:vitamin B12 transporter